MLSYKLDFEEIPSELKNRFLWMVANRIEKIPLCKDGIKRGANKQYCMSYDEAKNIVIKSNGDMVLSYHLDNDVFGIDLDDAIDENGNIKEWAKMILDNIKDGYIEISPSGHGIRAFMKMNKEYKNMKPIKIDVSNIHNRFANENGKIEIYTNKKNLTITGNVIKSSQLNTDSIVLLALVKELREKMKKNTTFSPPGKENVFTTIKGKINIIDIVQYYYTNVNNEYKVICPFHNEKTASLSINTVNNMFYCFGCDKGGDGIKFVSLLFKITNFEALKLVNKDFKLGLKFNLEDMPIDKDVDIFEILNNINTFKGNFSFENEINDLDQDIKIQYKNNYYDLDKKWGDGFYLNQKGFIRRTSNINIIEGNKVLLYIDKLITPIAIIPGKIILVNDSEEVEYLGIKNGLEKKVIAENDYFSSTTKFKTFLKMFFKTDSWFDGDVVSITAYEKYIGNYIKYTKMKRIKAIDSFGWNDSNSKFNPYNGSEIFIKDDSPVKELENAFQTKGNYQDWKNKIINLNDNFIFNFLFSAGLASPLTKVLHRPSFWVHNYSKFSGGKTPALLACASIWGKSSVLMQSFDTTKVGLEFLFHTMGNLPVHLDDDSLLDKYYKENPDKLIYLATNSKGKNRGTIRGEIQKHKQWKLNVISTGENSLLTNNSAGGANKRCMELYGKPIEDTKESKKCHLFFNENYGFYGSQYIEYIQKNKDLLIDLAYEFDEKFENKYNIETHILDVSTAAVANFIFLVDCLGLDQEEAKHRSLILGFSILDILPSADDTDKNIKGVKLIKEYIASNLNRFSANCPIGQVGYVKNQQVNFFPNQLSILLKDWSIPEKDFLTYIKENKLIELNNKGYFPVKSYKGISGQKIIFIKELIEIDNNYK